MHIELENVLPRDIEKRSMELLTAELPHPIDPEHADVVKRVIHTTADFEYADSLCFSPDVCRKTVALLKAARPSSPTPRWPTPASTRPPAASWA